MAGPDPHLLDLLCRRITAAAAQHAGLLVVGICGAQGSGKSTLAIALASRLDQQGTACAVLSLDDLYLTRAERAQLGRDVHPLLATRGVPGTHDVALGMAVIAALERGEPAKLPRFDKGRDDRADEAGWPCAPPRTRVLLLEGWCAGAAPQPASALAEPVNALEELEDPDLIWRSYANAALTGSYRQLFARIDLLVLLAAPGWDVVARWREEQEQVLRTAAAPRAMDPPEIARFIQHYERLTRWILAEMPSRADITVRLGPHRDVIAAS